MKRDCNLLRSCKTRESCGKH